MNRSSSWISVLPSLIIPICLGLTMFLGLSAMMETGVIENQTFIRYLTGHPVATATLILFFTGVGSLLMITGNVFSQYFSIGSIFFSKVDDEDAGERNDDTRNVNVALKFGEQLMEMPKKFRDHYLWRRLHESLHYIHRTGSPAGLDDETKYLADLDLDCQQQRYSLVRILIWATPMLGFLGTVLGISQALGGIDVGPDNDFQQMMSGLRASLYVAFDTTALALTLSIVLMFALFLIDRFETQLLRLVDYRARTELSKYFDTSTMAGGEALETMASGVLAATSEVVEKQAELWKKTIHAAENAWVSNVSEVNDQVQGSLTNALDAAIGNLGHSLDESINRADKAMTHRWQQWQVMLSENARALRQQQTEVMTQTQIVKEIFSCIEPGENETSSEKVALGPHRDGMEDSPIVHQGIADEPVEARVARRSQVRAILEPSELEPLKGLKPSALGSENESGRKAGTPELLIFDPNGESQESEAKVLLPRYRYAEIQSGINDAVEFPVQISEPLKKAA